MTVPFDPDDLAMLGRIIVYSMLVLWCAVLLGTAVRLFQWFGFGTW